MKTKHIFLIVLILLVGSVSIPIFHLLKTKWSETDFVLDVPKGFTDDESHLNLTPVDTVILAATEKQALFNQLRWVLYYARENNLKVSIAGARHSMGGHTITKEGVVINMLPFKHMSYDEGILTIGAGALWEDALTFLDSHQKSIAIMQAFSSFSVGGSLSVNGHGWQKNLPPISESVLSIDVMLASGEVLTCSRQQNRELFSAALGGYGLFGIILEAKLKVVDNMSLQYKYINMSTENYLSYYDKFITQNDSVELVFGRLRISEKAFLEEATLNFFVKTGLEPHVMPDHDESSFESKRVVFRSTVDSEYGKRLRWDLERAANVVNRNTLYSRNELLNDHVSLIENKDSTTTDILHEYFIPESHFLPFIEEIKPLLKNSSQDLLNITIRRVETDSLTLMAYAHEPVYGFVLLFNQKKTEASEEDMRELTQKLVTATVKHQGTYYLPYRLHIPKGVMRKVYPRTESFFALKKKYDPEEIFSNTFYEVYK